MKPPLPVVVVPALADSDEAFVASWQESRLVGGPSTYCTVTVPPLKGWRAYSANFAKGEKCPKTIESLEAAWERDQEVINDQRKEIQRLKKTINQLRQRK